MMADSSVLTAPPKQPKRSWTLCGFSGKARVATIFGNLPIEALRWRDELKTASGKYLRVAWVDQVHLDEDFLSRNPDAQPVLIRRGSLGRDKPVTDLMISPAQYVLSADQGISGKARSGRDLERNRPGILRKPVRSLTYFRFHCDTPALVSVEGIWCKTQP